MRFRRKRFRTEKKSRKETLLEWNSGNLEIGKKSVPERLPQPFCIDDQDTFFKQWGWYCRERDLAKWNAL